MKSGNAVCETGCICCWALLINIERPHGSPVEENEMKPRRPLLPNNSFNGRGPWPRSEGDGDGCMDGRVCMDGYFDGREKVGKDVSFFTVAVHNSIYGSSVITM